MKKKSNIAFLVVMPLLMLYSCSLVDMKYESVEQGEVGINLSLEWPEDAVDRPDSVNVALGRLINTYHDVFCLSSDADSTLILENGEYYILAFSKLDNVYEFGLLDDFKNESSISMKNITASVKQVLDEEKAEILGSDIMDFNPSVPFIYDAGHFYSSMKSEVLSPDRLTDVVLPLENLTCKLNLEFSIMAGTDVTINSVKAYLSGVVGYVYPMTGVVNHKNLCRINLPVQESGISDAISYKAQSNVLGLFAAKAPTHDVGPGILNIVVNADSNLGNRTYYARLNLYNTINDAGIMGVHDGNSGYFLQKGEVSLIVGNTLKIENSSVVNMGDGVDKWIESEIIDIDFGEESENQEDL